MFAFYQLFFAVARYILVAEKRKLLKQYQYEAIEEMPKSMLAVEDKTMMSRLGK